MRKVDPIPGPWHVDGWGFTSPVIYDARGMTIAKVAFNWAPDYSSEAAATARLIAEVPSMLEVLRGCEAALVEAGKDFARGNPLAARPNLFELHAQAARENIARATGEEVAR